MENLKNNYPNRPLLEIIKQWLRAGDIPYSLQCHLGISLELYDLLVTEITEEEQFLEEQKALWKNQLIDTEAAMLAAKVVTKEQAQEMRRKKLLADYETLLRADGDAERVKNEYTSRFINKDFLSKNEIDNAHNVPIRKIINNYKDTIKCLFHKEKSPSLHITNNKFYCFGCNEQGDTIKFVMKLKGMSFKEAVKFILL